MTKAAVDPGRCADPSHVASRLRWAAATTGPGIAPPVKRAEHVASAILRDIIEQRIQPGVRLENEAAMVERFEVGRGTLREALRILEVHGVISLRSGPGGGPVVESLDPHYASKSLSLHMSREGASLHELLDARLLLEPWVARLAAQSQERQSLADLDCVLHYQASIEEGNSEYLHAANLFHLALISMSGNRVIEFLTVMLKEMYTSRVVQKVALNPEHQAILLSEHRAIAESIRRGEADKAERLTREHLHVEFERVAPREEAVRRAIEWG